MHVFKEGPGIVVIRGAWYDLDVVDECTNVFKDIIREERESAAAGDHFETRPTVAYGMHTKTCGEQSRRIRTIRK